MALTLQQLTDRIQAILGSIDPDIIWPEAQISEWIVQAIRDYSAYFPRRLSLDISATPSGPVFGRLYDLPADFRAMVRVEYPYGQDPPIWLARRDESDADFGPGYYDIRLSRDAISASQLVIGESPAAGEKIIIHYLGLHDITLSAGDMLTVPDEDIEVLIQFVKMRAFEERLANQEKSPDPTSHLLTMLGTNARAAKQEYLDLIGRRQKAGGGMVRWSGKSD